MNNSKIIKCIEHCNYTSSDFVNYNQKTLSDICRHIKVTINDSNRNKVYKECIKYLNLSSWTMDNTDNIDSNIFCFNENSDNVNGTFENCISYSVPTGSEPLQSDNVSLEYTNASREIDFIRTERDPLIPSSTPSYAQMNALCLYTGWNGFTSIFDYLNWCYRVLV